MHFLYSLRRLLRQYPHACASVSLAPHICTDRWGGYGWAQKIGWLTDGAISLTGFGGACHVWRLRTLELSTSLAVNPSLVAALPSHHGLVQVHKLPAPHTLLPPSDKYSTLRGLSSSAGASAGSGENNLAFRCTRRRFIIETMHLDVEGGVTERRTTPSSSASVAHESEGRSLATVQVELERSSPPKVKKVKKKVAFHSDQPDLYDF